MLLGQDLEHAQELLVGELGERLLRVLVGALVAALLVDADEPVEDHRLPGGAQPVGDVVPAAAVSVAAAAMSTPTWLKRASAIWVAIVRCQIKV